MQGLCHGVRGRAGRPRRLSQCWLTGRTGRSARTVRPVKDDALIDLVGSLGEGRFASCALAFVNSRVQADHLSLLRFDSALVPHLSGAASRGSGKTALRAGRIYERAMLYRFDPSSQRVRSGAADGDVVLFRLAASEIRDAAYRSSIYRRFDLIERVSMIRRVMGRWILMNVYRDRASGAFDAADMTKLTDMAPLLAACAGKHLAMGESLPAEGSRASAASFEPLLKSLDVPLTERERQVCALALAGVTVSGIASSLGVRESTVATLRRRAYARLGISNLNSLFAMCLSRVRQPGS